MDYSFKQKIMTKKILVTGATGNIGSLVLPKLLETGVEVHALVRNEEKALKLEELGVKTFVGDYGSQEMLVQAAQNVDAVLAITPPGPDAVEQGEAIIQAAFSSGSPHLVRISAIGAAPDAPTENGRLHYESDKLLMNSGLSYTILRPHFFMQNLFMSVDTIKADGNMYWGMGEGSLGMIDVRDIVDCAVEVLVNGGHKNKIYNPTGAASISIYDAAEIISKSIDKTVNYVPVPIEAVGDAIRKAGWGEWGALAMMDYSKAYSEGWGDFVNDDVETITGNKSRSFQQFFDEVMKFGF
jgi:uncharacterized protein YbjT (DUF2867 family)